MFWPRLGDQSLKGIHVCYSLGQMLGCAYTICSYVQIKFLAHLPVDHHAYPVVSSLIHLCLFAAFTYYGFVSITTNLYLLFCCVLSIFALKWLVLKVLFCAAISKDSVSLLKFSFLSHVQVFSCEILFKVSTDFSSSQFCFLVIAILFSIVLSLSFLMAVISIFL